MMTLMEKHKHLVLIADDEKNFREILGIELKAFGFQVIEAENGKEVLEKLEDIKPELVVLDVNMPVMDGAQTFMEIKSKPEFADLKIMFLTNYGEPQEEFKGIDKEMAKKFGAVNYLNKKDDLNVLVEEIEKTLHETGGGSASAVPPRPEA